MRLLHVCILSMCIFMSCYWIWRGTILSSKRMSSSSDSDDQRARDPDLVFVPEVDASEELEDALMIWDDSPLAKKRALEKKLREQKATEEEREKNRLLEEEERARVQEAAEKRTAKEVDTGEPAEMIGEAPSQETYRQTVVIPSGCNEYSRWQQVVAVMSLRRMQQRDPKVNRFNIMRVISCHSNNSAPLLPDPRLSDFYVVDEDFTVSTGKPGALILNKPGALWRWLSEGSGKELPDNHELIIVDADFLFLPGGTIPYPVTQMGSPSAAHFILPADIYKKPEVLKFCEGKCAHYNAAWLQKHELGPPYAFRKGDAMELIKNWFEITRAMVVSTDDKWSWPGEWYVDMFGYMFGMEKAGLPHGPGVWGRFLVNAYEIWQTISNFDGVWCFHYAGDYKLEKIVKDGGKMRWHKHQYKSADIVQNTILSCDKDTQLKMWKGGDEKPLDFEAPSWLHDKTPTFYKGELPSTVEERHKWVMWTLYNGINDALDMYRKLIC